MLDYKTALIVTLCIAALPASAQVYDINEEIELRCTATTDLRERRTLYVNAITRRGGKLVAKKARVKTLPQIAAAFGYNEGDTVPVMLYPLMVDAQRACVRRVQRLRENLI